MRVPNRASIRSGPSPGLSASDSRKHESSAGRITAAGWSCGDIEEHAQIWGAHVQGVGI
ncbi:uncharacterized protein THITE_2092229 [Thermothielavioides terrestris NRRL 8126]|uniref:Uncharacterized protein n=1 Tax=Thermothielavioides terrestris (strain ATCC 38088 / NRRL 8126) TaxID=578455 RepID=G2RD30_THETT|nr:uncharacterized protein THITE_2092229 [Thermothielavioides terrestris NRRL 8126]AEO70723.1 hypothetical protein THITE_2092229 [Thermothielavioides terrestris NRRL 8126]